MNQPQHRAAVVGAGPAGLMAAEALLNAGCTVDVFERMPSVARKFLMAGKGGLNITHSEPAEAFVARYGAQRPWIEPLLNSFSPDDLREWTHALGVETFVGTSGRVFPHEMKAAPLLRAWLHRLRGAGARIHVRHRWTGWTEDGALRFDTPSGVAPHRASVVVLALGGASWPQLGSDGAWVSLLEARNVGVSPLRPANCGFDVDWSEHLRTRFAGAPVKSVAGRCVAPDGTLHERQGEFIVTEHGVEGSLIYALSAPLRDAIDTAGSATLALDLAPATALDRLTAELAHPRGSRSTSSHLQSRTGIKGVKSALLREVLPPHVFSDPSALAAAIKDLPLTLLRARPVAEAISTAGGVPHSALDEHLMLKRLPGVFIAGEMLDWEAPTGGYLLTACFATGLAAGNGAAAWLASRSR